MMEKFICSVCKEKKGSNSYFLDECEENKICYHCNKINELEIKSNKLKQKLENFIQEKISFKNKK